MSHNHTDNLSEAGRRLMERGATELALLQLNKYALDNGLISEEMYRKMEISIRMRNDDVPTKLD